MRAVFYVIDLALVLYIWVLIAAVVFSWLVALNMVNTRNQAIAMIGESLDRITEPALRPIRNAVPKLGGIDISPCHPVFDHHVHPVRHRALHPALRLLAAVATRRRRAGSAADRFEEDVSLGLTAAICSATKGRY